ncbi:DUF1642 domain-containing protein [Streptococcus parasanguinis]|uniref:DUF1642 domain-containing protein n=1 Tax=Streptococcus parasanguinis TaxID=1318 RepID=UPI00319E2EFB
MNKQKLIEKIGRLYTYGSKNFIKRKEVIDLVKQLDEPQKPVVPQFIAEFIAEQKKLGHTLSYSIDACMSDGVGEWYWDNSELFALAWIDGYTVEKEKRYFVKMKDLETGFNLLNRHKTENYWIFSSKDESVTYQVCHTRKELEEDGWGWVFDCPGIEIEEVE